MDDPAALEIFAILRKRDLPVPSGSSRRYKANVEKIKDGDVRGVAEVVRDVTLEDRDIGLTAGQTRLLGHARGILVSGLTERLGVDEAAVEQRLDEALA